MPSLIPRTVTTTFRPKHTPKAKNKPSYLRLSDPVCLSWYETLRDGKAGDACYQIFADWLEEIEQNRSDLAEFVKAFGFSKTACLLCFTDDRTPNGKIKIPLTEDLDPSMVGQMIRHRAVMGV